MKDLNNILKTVIHSEYSVILLLFLLIVVVGPFSPNFFTLQNLMNLLVRTTTIAIAAIGMTYVVITGGIDLSVGGIIVLTSYIGLAQFIYKMSLNVWLAVLLMILFGGFIGLLNGINIVVFGMPPFIATLAMLSLTRGLSLFLFEAKTYFGLPESYIFFGQGNVLGIPFPILAFLFLFVIFTFILQKTIFGRSVFAVGNNPKAAWLAGINVNSTIFFTYIVSGLTAGTAAVILSSRIASVVATLGVGLELDVVAAVVIGGTSLLGGEGHIINSIAGALIITTVGNILTLMRISPFIQEFSKGLVLWSAVLIDMARKGYIFRKPDE